MRTRLLLVSLAAYGFYAIGCFAVIAAILMPFVSGQGGWFWLGLTGGMAAFFQGFVFDLLGDMARRLACLEEEQSALRDSVPVQRF